MNVNASRRGFFGYLATAPLLAQQHAQSVERAVDVVSELSGWPAGAGLPRGIEACFPMSFLPLSGGEIEDISPSLLRQSPRCEPIAAPTHFIRAPLHHMRGIPEHVSRTRKPIRVRA